MSKFKEIKISDDEEPQIKVWVNTNKIVALRERPEYKTYYLFLQGGQCWEISSFDAHKILNG